MLGSIVLVLSVIAGTIVSGAFGGNVTGGLLGFISTIAVQVMISPPFSTRSRTFARFSSDQRFTYRQCFCLSVAFGLCIAGALGGFNRGALQIYSVLFGYVAFFIAMRTTLKGMALQPS